MYRFVNRFLMNDFSKDIVENINLKQNNITVFDIGCYLGSFSRSLQHRLKNKKIEARFMLFDANPNLKMTDFKYHNIVFSDKEEKKAFFINNFFPSSGSSLKNLVVNDKLWNFTRKLVTFNNKKIFSKINVKTETLDNFCKKDGIKLIDVLKIDAEGSEFDILKGAKKSLEITNILQIEVLEKKEKFRTKYESLLDFLETKYNFKVLKKKKVFSTSLFSNLECVDVLLRKS